MKDINECYELLIESAVSGVKSGTTYTVKKTAKGTLYVVDKGGKIIKLGADDLKKGKSNSVIKRGGAISYKLGKLGTKTTVKGVKGSLKAGARGSAGVVNKTYKLFKKPKTIPKVGRPDEYIEALKSEEKK